MLSRSLRSGALALALLAPAVARAQASLVVLGGASAPVSSLSDNANMGYNIGVGIDVAAPAVPVGVRFEAAYNSFGLKGFGGNVRIVTGTANAIFNVGPGKDAPYLIGGVGVYNRNFTTSNNSLYSNGATAAGLNGGGGLRFPMSGFSTFFEARYHVMLGNDVDGTNFQFIPITFGIQF